MTEREKRSLVAREWFDKAEEDVRVASILMKVGAECPTASIGFHAQQGAEKYLKGLLAFHGIAIPKTHDLERLVALVPQNIRIRLSLRDQRTLTTYATVTRYPGDYEPLTVPEARNALAMARQLRTDIFGNIPKNAIQRKTLK